VKEVRELDVELGWVRRAVGRRDIFWVDRGPLAVEVCPASCSSRRGTWYWLLRLHAEALLRVELGEAFSYTSSREGSQLVDLLYRSRYRLRKKPFLGIVLGICG